MKTLLLMRHAKSSWKEDHLADHERPLNKRGKKDAPRMGVLLHDKKLVPQSILCSSAVRARDTAKAVAESAGFKGDIQYLDRLYMAEADEFITVLRDLPDTVERVLIIGHNPGLETLLQVLSGRIESLPTAVVAFITLKISSWAELNNQLTGEIVEIWRPKELSEDDDQAQEKEKEQGKEKDKAKNKEKEPEKSKAKTKSKSKNDKKKDR
jgi:phosphohistidine phosphatase